MIPYYVALVKMGMAKLRGPGQEMMDIISEVAKERGVKIKSERTNKSNKKV